MEVARGDVLELSDDRVFLEDGGGDVKLFCVFGVFLKCMMTDLDVRMEVVMLSN